MGKKEFYVYVFLDQRHSGKWVYKNIVFNFKPFYVGIGVKYRITSHFTPTNLKKKSIKNNIIKSIMNDINELPIFYKIFENLTEKEASKIEIDIIKSFGKIKNKTGILSNITDGGDGINGYSHTDDYKNSLRKKVYQYDLNGDYIKEWNSLKDVVEFFGLSGGGAVRFSINGNGHCKKFLWSYEKKPKLPKYKNKNRPKYQYGIILNNSEHFFNNFIEIDKYFGKKVSKGNITSCTNGKLKTYLGFVWLKKLIIEN